MSEIERTPKQDQAIDETEKFLKAQTANALRSNKTYRGMSTAVAAAKAATGQFAEWISKDEKSLADEFFTAFDDGGFNEIFASAPNWK